MNAIEKAALIVEKLEWLKKANGGINFPLSAPEWSVLNLNDKECTGVPEYLPVNGASLSYMIECASRASCANIAIHWNNAENNNLALFIYLDLDGNIVGTIDDD